MEHVQSESWPYDGLSWWISAIHQACSPLRGDVFEDIHAEVDESKFMEALPDFYARTLAHLAMGNSTPRDARRLLFLAKALKKWRIAPSDLGLFRRSEAIKGFVERNNRAANAGLIPYPYDYWMRKLLREWLPEPEREGWAVTGRFGPGAVFERLSHPQRFEQLAGWVELGDHWPEVPLDHVCASDHTYARLCAVPKEYSKDRLITVEPSYASFAQAYVRELLQCSIHCGPLRGTAMDLEWVDGQVVQRRLALKASKNRQLATLDLKDASDNITYHQVCQVFPPWVCALLDVSRTPGYVARVPSESTPTHVYAPLHIYAGMGNGTTFTIETLFFSAFVKAYAIAHGLPRFVSVFGDDIICHSTTALALSRETQFEFFRLNKAKSFMAEDALREACGIFAYCGEDITVPKVDGYPNTWEGALALCDLHRRIIVDFPEESYLRRLAYLIADVRALPNWPFLIDGYPSINDEFVGYSAEPPTRYNRRYQRMEYQVSIQRPKVLSYSNDWRVAKKLNHPSPNIWYQALLAGMIGPGEAVINSPNHRRARMATLFPSGKRETRCVWAPCAGGQHPLCG